MTSITIEHSTSNAGPSAGDTLARNLAALGDRNRDLAERLAVTAPSPDVSFHPTPQNVEAVLLHSRPLCSKHRPIEEAQRLADGVDLVEHAVVVVFGFGAGYHVKVLAQRMKRTGVIVVFEPDVALLRAVFERIECASWLTEANVVWITDAEDRAAVAAKLDGSESILAQGVTFLEHPASRRRLGSAPAQFSELFRNYMSTAKTTLMTTLIRSVDTVRNLLLSIDHYATAGGVADLSRACADMPAVVVSAGPSMHRAIEALAQPGVRDRCIIIAVQTTLKPLLNAGIKPHFVTALDYHEISRRFYEQLDPRDVQDVTLIAEPKVHPIVLDVYPGPVRCCASGFLDALLGPLKRDMGNLRAGATVAHLALYVADLLGCNPIALAGQDLGFSDGLYYAPGIAIEDVWAPELGPFNTVEMMQWQRIARHRGHLQQVEDVHGRTIYTDAQMLTYLRQFERDFAELKQRGVTIIDVGEGGVPKQHTTAMPIDRFLDQHAAEPIQPPAVPSQQPDAQRVADARKRIDDVRRSVIALMHVARRTVTLLNQMLADQHDQQKMNRHFKRMERYRAEVDQRMDTFELLNQINQMGVFKRMKADRRLHMTSELQPIERQRAELERDLENVRWIADAAEEMQELLTDAARVLDGEQVRARPKPVRVDDEHAQRTRQPAVKPNVAALVAIDPQRNGLLQRRDLSMSWFNTNVLQATLRRLGRSKRLSSIVLLVPDDFDVEALVDRSTIGLNVEVERCGHSPYPPEHEAIAAARAWSASCWRGGVAGIGCYDELLCPQTMNRVMKQRGLTAALLVGPDWPLVQVTGAHGCDAVIDRHLEYPRQNTIVFTQAPPGLCGCVVSATEMDSLAQRNRLSTIGARLTYQPGAPQADPIAKDLNVQIDHRVRSSLIRATADDAQRLTRLQHALRQCRTLDELEALDALQVVERIESDDGACRESAPEHVILELTTRRTSAGVFARHRFDGIERADMDIDLLRAITRSWGDHPPAAVTFDGVGDPLRHEQFDTCIQLVRRSGVSAIHVRTELLCDRATIDRLMAAGPDVITIDLHADRAETYTAMMGVDRFKDVLMQIEYLLQQRRSLTGQAGLSALALPWVVPRLQRCATTYEDIDSFFDRWQQALGTAVLESPPKQQQDCADQDDALLPAITPRKVVRRELRRRMTIFCDGSVPADECDLAGTTSIGNIAEMNFTEAWNALLGARMTRLDELNLRRP